MTEDLFAQLKERSRQWRSDQPSDRIARLKRIQSWIVKNNSSIVAALKSDFDKPEFETNLSEIFPTLSEIKHIRRNLKSWMKNNYVTTPLPLLGHRSWIRYENKGVVLVIAPWNYPFQLALIPLVTALAAGNTVILKPSELTPQTAELLKRFAAECFRPDEVSVELGAKEKTQELLTYNFDHVFFTGSTAVGKVIAKACAERLIPVTLELGGKSPTIVDETADLVVTSEKIFWGKFLNAGQTCVAPDYLVVHASVAAELTGKLKALANVHRSDEHAEVVNTTHAERLTKMSQGEAGPLALVTDPKSTDLVMQEEIFGPVLPILKYQSFADLVSIVREFDAPLALYVFSKNKSFIEKVLRAFPSGGVGINAVIVHLANQHLPFGGIGQSGYGRYHGHFGFLELSHQRAVIQQNYFGFLRKLMQPPYTNWKKKLISYF